MDNLINQQQALIQSLCEQVAVFYKQRVSQLPRRDFVETDYYRLVCRSETRSLKARDMQKSSGHTDCLRAIDGWYADYLAGWVLLVFFTRESLGVDNVAGDVSEQDQTATRDAAISALRDQCKNLLSADQPFYGVIIQQRTRQGAGILYTSSVLPEKLIVREDGIHYILQPQRGQNPGLFPESRYARFLVRRLARGRRVLNLFSYTCAFSLSALSGGATEVINVDMNKSALDRGRENHQLNRLGERQSRFLALDIKKSYARLERYGPYGLIICDPPPAQGASFSSRKDYPRLLRRCVKMLAPDSCLLVMDNRTHGGYRSLFGVLQDSGIDLELVTPCCSLLVPPDMAADGRGIKALLLRRTN